MSALPDRDLLESPAGLRLVPPAETVQPEDLHGGLGELMEVMPEHDIVELFDAVYEDANGELPYLRWPAVHRGELVENPRYEDPYRPLSPFERKRQRRRPKPKSSTTPGPPRQAPAAVSTRDLPPHAGSPAPAAPTPRLLEVWAWVAENRDGLLKQVARERAGASLGAAPEASSVFPASARKARRRKGRVT